MLTCINEVLEMIAVLICVNHFFCRKYYFTVHDAIFLISEVIIIEISNFMGLSKGMALFGYLGVYIYELTKFKCPVRKASVNLVLFIIIGVFVQVVCSIPVFMLADWVQMDLLVILVNSLTIILFLVFSKRGFFFKLSRQIMIYDKLANTATLICFAGAVYLLVAYKLEEYLRITDYIIFGLWTLLIGVLIMRWQQERYIKLAREKELELHNTYDAVYEQLLESIRRKQHDFHNQILAIQSQHLIAKDYETLVSLQKKYCGEILEDSRYARLLSSGSPMVVAFLYSKFVEAESKGCHVEYDVKVDKLQCRIPQYKLIEILGVLLDNAMEAVEAQASKNIYVKLLEMTDLIRVAVKNDSRHFEKTELAMFVKPDYSTKDAGRGIGLAKVMEILMEHDCHLDIYCEREQTERIVFEFEIEKEE